MPDVVVRLTDAQRGALRSIADVTRDAGEGGPALARGVEALDANVPVLTRAEYDAFIAAIALLDVTLEQDGYVEGDHEQNRRNAAQRAALARMHTKVRQAMTPRGDGYRG